MFKLLGTLRRANKPETAVVCFLVLALTMSGLADRSAILKEYLFTLFDRSLQWPVFL